MMSFRQFLFEMAVKQQAIAVAKDLLDVIEIEPASITDEELNTAKEVKKNVVKSVLGSWIVSLFKTPTKSFAAVYPPKDDGSKPMFFVAKDTK